MDLRDFNHGDPDHAAAAWARNDPPQEVRISLVLSVEDRGALWDAAAIKGMSAPGMRLGDVIDVIGPREDPAIAECIAMLAQPAPLPGCSLGGFDVEAVSPAQPSSPALRRVA